MPNNPANRKIGAIETPAANKIVRGQAQAAAISASTTSLKDTQGASDLAPSTPEIIPTPKGIIAMWSGTLATIPPTWTLCNGSSGTPDLRGLFIKGSAAGIDPGVTGGAPTHTPAGTVSAPTFTGGSNTTSSVSAGTPAGTINAHTTDTLLLAAGATTFLTGPTTHTFTGSALSGHTHSVTPTGTNSTPTFTGTSANYEPAFYALAYIMKL